MDNKQKEGMSVFFGAIGAFLIGLGVSQCSIFIGLIGMILFIPSSINVGKFPERRRWTGE